MVLDIAVVPLADISDWKCLPTRSSTLDPLFVDCVGQALPSAVLASESLDGTTTVLPWVKCGRKLGAK